MGLYFFFIEKEHDITTLEANNLTTGTRVYDSKMMAQNSVIIWSIFFKVEIFRATDGQRRS